MATAPSQKRSKFTPTTKVWADDYELTGPDGEKHYPHAGEYVLFRQGVKLSVLRQLAFIQSQQVDLRQSQTDEADDRVAADSAQATAGVAILERLIKLVFGQIVHWTLTTDVVDEKATALAREDDPDAELVYVRLPSPVTAREDALEAMWQFDNSFLAWLQGHMMDGSVAPNTSSSPSPVT